MTDTQATSQAGVGFGRSIFLLLLGAVLGAGGMAAYGHFAHPAAQEAQAPAAQYHCPMHPIYTIDRQGDCPICGMKLTPIGTQAQGPAAARKPRFYRSPMDPKRTSPVPMKDEMGMNFIPVFDETTATAAVDGLSTVQISPERQQLLGVRGVAAAMGPVGGSWKATARVAADERKVRRITVKFEGFIEKIQGLVVGQSVHKGQPLATLYSPELLGAENEFVLAVQTDKATGGSSGLAATARTRLQLMDVPKGTIDSMARGGKAPRTYSVSAPTAGIVTAASVVPGSRVVPGDALFEVSDLSHVWVFADVRMPDLARVHLGMAATVSVASLPGRTFPGTVSLIDPNVDPKTRTVRVRIAVDNPNGELRPDLFGEVELLEEPREGLRIPRDAVVDSGTRQVVFLVQPDGHFEPRPVQLGAVVGEEVEVVHGLVVGDRVVTRANFLLDSESRLQSALSSMSGGAK